MARSSRNWPRRPLAGPALRGNRLSLKAGGPELLCLLVHEDKADTLRVEDLSSGKPVTVATVADLPAGSDYAVGQFPRLALARVPVLQAGRART